METIDFPFVESRRTAYSLTYVRGRSVSTSTQSIIVIALYVYREYRVTNLPTNIPVNKVYAIFFPFGGYILNLKSFLTKSYVIYLCFVYFMI